MFKIKGYLNDKNDKKTNKSKYYATNVCKIQPVPTDQKFLNKSENKRTL